MERGISAVLRRQGMHENTQAFSQAGTRDYHSSWRALVKFESSTLLSRLDTQNSTPPWTVRPACLCCWNHILTLQLPSLCPPLFQPVLNYKSLFKQRDTLGLKHILWFFPIPTSCPFPSRNHPHMQCLLCLKELPTSQAHPSPPGLQITGVLLPLALQPRLKRGESKQLWINNTNSNGGVMNVHY